MSWAKIDDQFHAHPKIASMDYRMLAAVGLHTLALSWCASQLTDGFVPENQPARLAGNTGRLLPRTGVAGLVDCLLSAGMWERVEGGYQIHDYLDYNPSKDAVLSERAKVKGRVDKWRNGHRNAVTNGGGNGDSNGVYNAAPVPDVPTVHKEEQASPFATPEEKAMYLEFAERQRLEDEARGIHRGC